jgi:hypothetical protein
MLRSAGDQLPLRQGMQRHIEGSSRPSIHDADVAFQRSSGPSDCRVESTRHASPRREVPGTVFGNSLEGAIMNDAHPDSSARQLRGLGGNRPTIHRLQRVAALALAPPLVVLAGLMAVGGQSPAVAVATSVDLGTATSFSVLGGQSVTNTGPSVLSGDLGVSPGSSITGFPPGTFGGALHNNDAVADQAQEDLTDAYNDAAGQATDTTLTSPGDLGGLTLTPGVYTASTSVGLTGTLTLDAENNPDAVFVFQIGSTLTTASNSAISLINGADPCNV